MIPFKPDMTNEEKQHVARIALQKEKADALAKAEEDFKEQRRRRTYAPHDVVGMVYAVATWHKDPELGFWGWKPPVDRTKCRYRLYFFVYSDILKEAVQVGCVEESYKVMRRRIGQ